MGRAEQLAGLFLGSTVWNGVVGAEMTKEQGVWEEWQEEWVVDGLEQSPRGPLARVELPSGRTRVLHLRDLPEGVQEGDLLEVRGTPSGLSFRRLERETQERRSAAQAQLERLNASAPSTSAQQSPQALQHNADGEVVL